jgi:hypothetical protein
LRLSILFALTVSSLLAQQQQMKLSALDGGATVSFVKSVSGKWGIAVTGAAPVSQDQPARLEVYSNGAARQIAAGYDSVKISAASAQAQAHVPAGDAAFHFDDEWRVSGAVLSLRRKVEVTGNAPRAGFYSAILFSTGPGAAWTDLDYLAPGLLYGGPHDNGDRSAGGLLNYRQRRFSFREDFLEAPLFGISFRNGNSITAFDPAPRGDTTTEESRSNAGKVLIDERYQFGGFGASEAANAGVAFGYWLPGTISEYGGGRGSQPLAAPVWRRRYHPVQQGFVQRYAADFRFGRDESFNDLIRNSWRWAWQTLQPPVMHIDVEQVRQVLLDHLADWTITVDGRTGLPYLRDARTGKLQDRGDSDRAAMGFCAKNIEAADYLLREGDRDRGPRGQKMRRLGLDIIATFIRMLPPAPLAGDGFDLDTGKGEQAVWSAGQQFLRAPSDDMRVLVEAYRREQTLGRDHPEWLRWCREFADWLLPQQRDDGSFPRAWKPGTSEVVNASGSATYSPIPLLVDLTKATRDKKYLDSAVRAGEYLWADYGTRGYYVGGALDNPDITDKEGGLLSLEAFLSLYDATNDQRWLIRAGHAADYTETWIRIWNTPIPQDGDDAELHWKKNVSTVGLQGITARGAGGADEYLDWSAPAYAKLYKYTKDRHYLDVALILLHDTKSMLAMPGRTYGLVGPGWQIENWSLAYNRGYGTPGKSLPWLTINHLHSIFGLEDVDPELFRRMSAKQ